MNIDFYIEEVVPLKRVIEFFAKAKSIGTNEIYLYEENIGDPDAKYFLAHHTFPHGFKTRIGVLSRIEENSSDRYKYLQTICELSNSRVFIDESEYDGKLFTPGKRMQQVKFELRPVNESEYDYLFVVDSPRNAQTC